MRTRLTFQELEKFIDVAETLSFRASAVRCCISQPALSRTIASAEAKLGTRLFDRNTRGVTLTSSGKQLLPIARRIFFELNGSLSDLSEFLAGHRGQISIASIPSVAAALLPIPTQTYLNAHPGVSIELKSVSASDVVAAVAGGDADIGISALASVGAGTIAGDHEFTPFVQDDLILMCSKDDPLARQEAVSWDVFATRPYIANGPASSLRALVQRAIAEAGVTAAPRYESMNLAVTARMVAAGLGIAVLSSLSRSMINADGLALVALNGPRLSRSIGVITRRGRSLSKPAQEFLQHFLQNHGHTLDTRGDKAALSR
jgi:LysR family carnitine catabolism transcriptional activator